MKTLYCDASFDWTHTESTEDNVVRGKIAVVGDDVKLVNKVAIGKVPDLKQYINILELVAIARAIEVANDMGWEGNLTIYTDSQVAMSWASKGKTHKKTIATEAHKSAFDYLKESMLVFKGTPIFKFMPRDQNKAGHLLEEELKKEKPYIA